MDDRDRGMTVADAAVQLGISKEAVRKRVHRGTLRSYRDADGTVRVYLQTSSTASSTEITDELREQIAHLKGEVDYLRDENRRKDHIIAGLVQRVPELESRQPSETAAQQAPEGEPDPEHREAKAEPESSVSRVWRWFRG